LLGLVLVGPVLASPIRHSLHPGEHATTPRFRPFPVELTMLNDLSVFTDTWRKKRPYGSYELYFLDDGTYGQESSFGQEGFWLRGGEQAEVVLAGAGAMARVRLRVTGGPRGDIVTVALGADRRRLVVGALKTEEVSFEGKGAVAYYGRQLQRFRLASRFAGTLGDDTRPLGAFVVIVTEPVEPGPR
jgi:hypothetical protein